MKKLRKFVFLGFSPSVAPKNFKLYTYLHLKYARIKIEKIKFFEILVSQFRLLPNLRSQNKIKKIVIFNKFWFVNLLVES